MKDVTLTVTNGLSGDIQMNNDASSSVTELDINGTITYTNGINGINMLNNSQINGTGTLNNQGTISYGASVAGSPSGTIGHGGTLAVQNSGTISAGGSASQLRLYTDAGWTNSGIILSQSGALVLLNCYQITCTGQVEQQNLGEISASGGNVQVGLGSNNVAITGGTLAAPFGGGFTGAMLPSTI
jgi:hypothetical protein